MLKITVSRNNSEPANQPQAESNLPESQKRIADVIGLTLASAGGAYLLTRDKNKVLNLLKQTLRSARSSSFGIMKSLRGRKSIPRPNKVATLLTQIGDDIEDKFGLSAFGVDYNRALRMLQGDRSAYYELIDSGKFEPTRQFIRALGFASNPNRTLYAIARSSRQAPRSPAEMVQLGYDLVKAEDAYRFLKNKAQKTGFVSAYANARNITQEEAMDRIKKTLTVMENYNPQLYTDVDVDVLDAAVRSEQARILSPVAIGINQPERAKSIVGLLSPQALESWKSYNDYRVRENLLRRRRIV
jgi:hypothetical protein